MSTKDIQKYGLKNSYTCVFAADENGFGCASSSFLQSVCYTLGSRVVLLYTKDVGINNLGGVGRKQNS